MKGSIATKQTRGTLNAASMLRVFLPTFSCALRVSLLKLVSYASWAIHYEAAHRAQAGRQLANQSSTEVDDKNEAAVHSAGHLIKTAKYFVAV